MMDNAYWHNRWETNDIKFHINEIYEPLVRYFSNLEKGTVLVPLCGKTLDLMWLASEGHTVIGVELSAIACDAFFAENKLTPTITEEYGLLKYTCHNMTLWCADFFALPIHVFANVTAIYDRAALFALTPELRIQYAMRIKEIAKWLSKLDMLLITVEYDSSTIQAPPFVVSENEIHQLYSDVFLIDKLPAEKVSAFRDHPKFKNITIVDQAYFLKKI